MLEHVVLMRLKPGTTPEQLQTMGEKLGEMAGHVRGVLQVVAGRNVSPERKHQGYDYVLLVRFKDEDARDAYLVDGFHQRVVVNYVEPVVEQVIVADVLGSA